MNSWFIIQGCFATVPQWLHWKNIPYHSISWCILSTDVYCIFTQRTNDAYWLIDVCIMSSIGQHFGILAYFWVCFAFWEFPSRFHYQQRHTENVSVPCGIVDTHEKDATTSTTTPVSWRCAMWRSFPVSGRDEDDGDDDGWMMMDE